MQLELNINGYLSQVMLMPKEVNEVYKPLLKRISHLRNKQTKSKRTKILLAGPPGSGKSTFASVLEELAHQQKSFSIQALGLDGFHFKNTYLRSNFISYNGKELTLEAIKGAPETYDIKSLLKQWQLLDNPNAQWPVYDRTLHEPVSNKIVLKSEVLLLEGNWVLLDEEKWRVLSAQADLTIFYVQAKNRFVNDLKPEKNVEVLVRRSRSHYLRTDKPNVYRVLTKSLPADLELIWTTDTEPSQLAFRTSQDLDII